MRKPEDIALFDMDGTLCDYDSSMFEALELLRGPNERVYHAHDNLPDHINRRRELISSSEEFWENLRRLKEGFDILEIARNLDFKLMILTQAPRNKPYALSGKKKWLDNNLPDIDFTMTRDKGLVYGKVLVDDFPPYVDRWLRWRKNGLVVMPASPSNEGYSHVQVVRYDGSNIDEVLDRMTFAKNR